jgi:hypothetical protein
VNSDQLLFAEGSSCHEFEGWLRVKQSGIAIDFRRILRCGSDVPELESYLFDDSEIEEMGMICESSGIENGLYRRPENSSLIVMKSILFHG